MKHRHFDERRIQRKKQEGRRFMGVILAIVGSLVLLKKFNVIPNFSPHDFWPYILIVIGLFIGIQNKFKNPAPWILILIGAAHLIPSFHVADINGKSIYSNDLVIPVSLIIGGVFLFIFRPQNKNCKKYSAEVFTNAEETIDINVTFGGRKEIITSRNFTGGRINATFSGCELNLMQADASQPIIIDVKLAFAGLEIIVPSHWEVRNEISPTMGSVEDERVIRTPSALEERKVLILQGSVTFGGVEIKGY